MTDEPAQAKEPFSSNHEVSTLPAERRQKSYRIRCSPREWAILQNIAKEARLKSPAGILRRIAAKHDPEIAVQQQHATDRLIQVITPPKQPPGPEPDQRIEQPVCRSCEQFDNHERCSRRLGERTGQDDAETWCYCPECWE